jgi:tRNA pseudouridine55 synthase
VRFLTASDKDYDATVRFGLSTDTYDVTGRPTSASGTPPDAEGLAAALETLRGEYLQMPPAYSAKKVGGERAYALARQEQPVTLTAVPVSVRKAELIDLAGHEARFAITCSAGFYVRVFAHELGERVGTGACLSALRRTRSGEFTLADALDVATLQADRGAAAARLVPVDRLLPRLPGVVLSDEGCRRVSHGLEVDERHLAGGAAPPVAGAAPAAGATARTDAGTDGEAWVRLLDGGGRLIAMARPGTRPGALHPSIVLT